MSKYTKKILDLIAQKPGIRTVEIAEEVDCDMEHVDVAIAKEIRSGIVLSEQIIAPNGRPQFSYRICEQKQVAIEQEKREAAQLSLRTESVNALWSE